MFTTVDQQAIAAKDKNEGGKIQAEDGHASAGKA